MYAYLRVSTDNQDVEAQKLGIMEYARSQGLEPVELVDDTVSGAVGWRKRGIGQLIESAGKGDVILVAEVSRMARSTLQVLEIMRESARKEVSIHIVKNNMVMDGSMASKITVTILGLAAEIEKEFISERTKEGLARRKAEGVKLGRPKGSMAKEVKLDKHKKDIIKYLGKGVSKASIAKIFDVSKTTLYRYIDRVGIKS